MAQENPTNNSGTTGPFAFEQSEGIYSRSPIESLSPHPRNLRRYNRGQLRALASSMRSFGFIAPVVVDGTGQILAGHARVEAAKKLGLATVPTVRIEHLSEAQARAYMLADNKISELSSWDKNKLALELKELSELTLDFDLGATGFEAPEIDLLVQSLQLDDMDEADDFKISSDLPITRLGDTWILGNHKIKCDSALDERSYEALFGTDKASAVFTDPPYNVKIGGHVRGKGENPHREFVMGSGMTAPEFEEFLSKSTQLASSYAVPGAVIYMCMDWRHIEPLLSAARRNALDFLNLCVWAKTNGGMGSFYRSRHELVFVFRNGKSPHINNIQLGKHGRNRTNVWHYAGANTFARARKADAFESHPTVKPIRLVADALLDCTLRGDIVLDCFLGSGTTLLAAERTGRRCFGIELDPVHVDTAIRRWEQLTKKNAVNQDGLTFAQASAATKGLAT